MKNLISVTKFTSVLLLVSQITFASEKLTPGVYSIDQNHTKVGFEVPHMVISTVEGHFKSFAGEITLADTLDKSKVETTIKTSSVDTSNETRDKHLRGEDFFNVEKFPTITFKSKSITGPANALLVKGDLTLKGVTQEVILKAKYKGSVLNGMNIPTIAFDATTEISRKEFGLLYNKLIEAGPAIGDKVTITLRIEANKI